MATLRFELDAATVEELMRDAQTEASELSSANLRPRLIKAKIVEVGPGGRFQGTFTFRVEASASSAPRRTLGANV